jgi:hypothetical protein
MERSPELLARKIEFRFGPPVDGGSFKTRGSGKKKAWFSNDDKRQGNCVSGALESRQPASIAVGD